MDYLKVYNKYDELTKDTDPKDAEFHKLVKQAIRKQIPMTPNNIEVFHDITACIPLGQSGNCPICGAYMQDCTPWCEHCGQSIKWPPLPPEEECYKVRGVTSTEKPPWKDK